MKMFPKIMGLGVLCCFLAISARADLLGVNPGYPQINYTSVDPNSVTYDPSNQLFRISSLPLGIAFSGADVGSLFTSNSSIQIQLNTEGTMVSGTNGFILTGQFTHVDGGVTNTYSGTLLQGDVIGFGYIDSSFLDEYDFRVHVTGGMLMPLFTCGDDLAIFLVSEVSTFHGNFAEEFHGTAHGLCGPEDLTLPKVTCPPVSQVVTTAATNEDNVPGFIITYPDPTVTDNCDPIPTIFCDVPSGTFLALNPGDTVTVTCYGIDVSGNFDFCSFDAVMHQAQSGSCPIAFNDGGCGLITLTNDLGKCAATFTFSAPVATNCSGQILVASATAVNQSGMAISLTNLGNGTFQGVFPHTTSGTNVVTFTADDGGGHTVTRQCFVAVVDGEAPTILCKNQAGTFKPIETNALSCIEADFDDVCITASNYLWFTSSIQTPSSRNSSFTVHIFDQTIQLSVDNTNIILNVPEAYVIFSNGVATATTTFSNGVWITITKPGLSGNTFASGLQWQIPFDLNSRVGNIWGRDRDDGHSRFRRHVNTATWCARFAIDKPGIAVQWQWGAVVHSSMNTNCNTLGIKPCDDDHSSGWRNSDPAGCCENFKSFLTCGARGKGWRGSDHDRQPDCTGVLSDTKRANLGIGIVCEGPVEFTTPLAADNCDNSATVTCNPPSGSIFGPGDHTIVTTAVDSSGNSNTCSFTLTVLSPVHVVFDSPCDDNINDNTCERDAGFTDMNCPDDPSTPEIVTRFNVGDKICHTVRLLDCNDNDVTCQLASFCTVHIDVTERQGSYYDSILVRDLTEGFVGVGTPGGIMVPRGSSFQYVLDTRGYEARTVNNSKFFRACVWVDYNTSPGVPVGMEDVVLESK